MIIIDCELRWGIIAVIIDESGKVLLFERSDRLDSWQFPQGGIKSGETPEQALFRELEEEVGTISANFFFQFAK